MACDRKIGPFDCCNVVCCDCLEAMRKLPDGCVDAVITDPPYGMKKAEWDMHMYPPESWLPSCRRMGAVLLFCGVKGIHDYPKSDWTIAWSRAASTQRNGALKGFNNWEPILVYGLDSLDNDLFSVPNFPDDEAAEHPTPKPLRLMRYIVERTTKYADTILDPFCGSGTTLVAAKKLGRHYLGFEISPEYCEIARRRLAEVEAQPTLFDKQPEQLIL